MSEKIRTDIVSIADGEYSDYSNSIWRVLKPFTFAEAKEAFLKGFKKENDWSRPDPSSFTGWLAESGYIEDFPIHEVHVGSYGTVEVSDYMGDIVFSPKAEQ